MAEPREIECPECNGRGYLSRAEHASGCDGSCRTGCPVEVQVPCFMCGGERTVPILDTTAFLAAEPKEPA